MSLLDAPHRFGARQRLLLALAGGLLFLLAWWALAELLARERAVVDYNTRLPSSIVTDSTTTADRDSLLRADSLALANAREYEKVYPLLPPPLQVARAFPPLLTEDQLAANTWLSIWRNLQGYFWAVFVALLIGFPIGLSPALRGLFSRQVDALRYLPLTALTGLFILWFGLGETMKVAFLAFGILVYLLPVVVQRIDETEGVYLKTTFTLGATDWQMIRSVYLPAVLSKLIDDIRVLTAISWTYIIIAELLNRQGGVGSLIYIKARQGQVDRVFAVLLVIVAVGFLQDRLFVYLDRRLFPYKYFPRRPAGLSEIQLGLCTVLAAVMVYLLLQALLPLPAVLTQVLIVVIVASALMVLYGEYRHRTQTTA